MLGNERQRAYRYGMTLLCVGVFFNWLSITENNSDPVRFVGFTCLASGALLVCMAICLWANSARQHNSQVGNSISYRLAYLGGRTLIFHLRGNTTSLKQKNNKNLLFVETRFQQLHLPYSMSTSSFLSSPLSPPSTG
jgi:hypothetical protein